jgi:hypothetical protein
MFTIVPVLWHFLMIMALLALLIYLRILIIAVGNPPVVIKWISILLANESALYRPVIYNFPFHFHLSSLVTINTSSTISQQWHWLSCTTQCYEPRSVVN